MVSRKGVSKWRILNAREKCDEFVSVRRIVISGNVWPRRTMIADVNQKNCSMVVARAGIAKFSVYGMPQKNNDGQRFQPNFQERDKTLNELLRTSCCCVHLTM